MHSRPVRYRPVLILACALALATAAPGKAAPGRPSFQPLGDQSDGGATVRTGIESLALDPGGVLWIGTQDGAAWYDGRIFREVELPQRQRSNWVHAIEPLGGDVFFATDAGIARRRSSFLGSETWRHFGVGDGLPSEVVRALAVHGGRLVAATDGGLAALDGERFAPLPAAGLPAGPAPRLLAAGADGALWLGGDFGLGRLERGAFHAEPLFAGRPVGALLADPHGVLAAAPGAVYRRDAGASGWTALAGPAAFVGWRVDALARFAGGGEGNESIFFGGERGLRRLAGGELAGWGYAEGLPTGSLRALLAAPGLDSDLLFLGATTGGLVRAQLNGWNVLDARSAPLPRDDINAIGEVAHGDSVAYFFGTETGIARFSRQSGAAGRWELFTTASSDLPSDNVNGVLQAEGGEVYFATEGGLLVVPGEGAVLGPLRGRVFRPENSPLPDAALLTLLRSRRGGMLIGTRGGLAWHRLDGGWEITREGPDGLPDRQVYALAEVEAGGESQLWVGTRRGGLAVLAGGRWRRFAPGSSPLPNLWVNCLTVDPGPDGRPRLWAGTDGGAVRFDPAATADPWLVLTEKSEPALPNQVIYQIRRDARGRLLFFTNRGAARSRGSGENLALEVLSTADGLPANDFTQWGSMTDRAGRLWAGSSRGLAIYDAPLESATLPPSRRLRWLAAEIENGQAPRAADPAGGSELAWNERLLLRYGLPQLAGGESITYRTQLVGLEEEPATATAIGERLFSHLPSGAYLFRVVATDARGNQSLPLELRFAVRPAPWWSGWAIGLYAVVLAGLLLLGLARREAAQRASQAALEALVAERTASLELSEAEARQAREEAEEANRVKGRFLANMSHELRTPLNGVIGLTSLLERTPLDLNQRRYLENLRTSGQHLLALVSDVLDFEKIAAGNLELDPQPIAPAAFLESLAQAARPEAEAKGIELRLEGLGELPPRVAIDARRLRQVLLNLLSNALKFTPAGTVTLRAGAESGEGRLRFAFEVADTGIGIPRERQGRLFKPFSQVDSSTTRLYGGTGLGLAICKALVERMGGSIEVDSALGEGSTFRFTCLAEAIAGETDPGAPAPAGFLRGRRAGKRPGTRRVLLAEDQPINQIVAVAMLEELGCEVELAADGRAAVERATAESFDLIVLDLQMPQLDGLEAAQLIRAHPGARAPIVLLTADVRPEIRHRSQKEGIDFFLAKPVLLEDFADLLRRLEERPGPR